MNQIGDIFSARVRDLASDGRAIVAHPNGQTFFVAGLWLGELAEVKITGFKGRIGFAELLKVIEASAQRTTAPCPHSGVKAGDCGGCPWQFVEYSAQLEHKFQRVLQAMQRLGWQDKVLPIRGATKSFGYRNRAQFKTDGDRLGYLSQGSRDLAIIDDCIILTDHNRETLKQLHARLPNAAWKPSSKDRKRQHWTRLDIDESTTAVEASVNARLPFQQANSEQNQFMLHWLADILADMDKSQTVLELFCGSGNFTQVIADAGFEHVLAVEAVAQAMVDLKAKQLAAVKTYVCDLYEENAFGKIYQQLRLHKREANILLLDPPRDGLKNIAGLLPKKSKIEHVIYISCDLATFGRDLAFFKDNKFQLQALQPLDQFPHTPHIELMAHLVR